MLPQAALQIMWHHFLNAATMANSLHGPSSNITHTFQSFSKTQQKLSYRDSKMFQHRETNLNWDICHCWFGNTLSLHNVSTTTDCFSYCFALRNQPNFPQGSVWLGQSLYTCNRYLSIWHSRHSVLKRITYFCKESGTYPSSSSKDNSSPQREQNVCSSWIEKILAFRNSCFL